MDWWIASSSISVSVAASNSRFESNISIDLPQYVEYRDTLFMACLDLTTPKDLFGMVSRRFDEAELGLRHRPEMRVAVQYKYANSRPRIWRPQLIYLSIFMVIMHWLSNQYLQVDPQLLSQMRGFCESVIRKKSSPTMVNKAGDLLCQIKARVSFNFLVISQSHICHARKLSSRVLRLFLLLEEEFKRPKLSQMSLPLPLLCLKGTNTKS